jgi:soluble P-type ATPase
MKTKLLMLTAVMTCAFAGQAMAMTKEEYKAQGDRISADYKASRDKCASLKDNAKDICVAEAKGTEKVAKAELEAQYKPSPRNDEKLTVAKGDAAYDVAKEKCDDLKGNEKDVCVKDAKAAHVKVKENAKVAAAAADKNSSNKAANVAETKKDANAEKREADYKAAKERCDALTGAAKDGCQNDAKAKFGMK